MRRYTRAFAAAAVAVPLALAVPTAAAQGNPTPPARAELGGMLPMIAATGMVAMLSGGILADWGSRQR